MAIGSPNVTSRVAAIMAAGMVVLCGCPTTRQTRTVEKSGFLGDYSQLREGGQGEAQLVYIKPGVRWASYDKVVIDPVTIWTSGDSSVAKVSDADRQLLADYLDASLRNSLSQIASDTQVLVGRAGVEGEILDGVTEERLAAAVDRRAGTKALRGGISTWADVQNAFDFWSERLRTRLAELRKSG